MTECTHQHAVLYLHTDIADAFRFDGETIVQEERWHHSVLSPNFEVSCPTCCGTFLYAGTRVTEIPAWALRLYDKALEQWLDKDLEKEYRTLRQQIYWLRMTLLEDSHRQDNEYKRGMRKCLQQLLPLLQALYHVVSQPESERDEHTNT